MWPVTSQWVIIGAISSKTYWFVCKGRPQCCGGEGKSQGGCFLRGIVSVWVSYLQGAAVPHSLFFAPMCDTEAQLTTPLFASFRFSVRICIKLCVCPCACAVRTHTLAACSCCDRWSAAHAQITRPILLKSGLCSLSSSRSLLVPLSPNVLAQCQSPYLTDRFLKQLEVRILDRAVQICNPPLEWWFKAASPENKVTGTNKGSDD